MGQEFSLLFFLPLLTLFGKEDRLNNKVPGQKEFNSCRLNPVTTKRCTSVADRGKRDSCRTSNKFRVTFRGDSSPERTGRAGRLNDPHTPNNELTMKTDTVTRKLVTRNLRSYL